MAKIVKYLASVIPNFDKNTFEKNNNSQTEIENTNIFEMLLQEKEKMIQSLKEDKEFLQGLLLVELRNLGKLQKVLIETVIAEANQNKFMVQIQSDSVPLSK